MSTLSIDQLMSVKQVKGKTPDYSYNYVSYFNQKRAVNPGEAKFYENSRPIVTANENLFFDRVPKSQPM